MRFALLLFCTGVAAQAATLDAAGLEKDFRKLVAGFGGRVGVCAQAEAAPVCLNAGQRFSMQSVMKMLVGMAVMDAVDRRGWKLETKLLIRKQDLSLYMQPIAKLVGPNGYETTIGDLVRRAIVDSDSAAADILLARLGGPDVVNKLLDRHGINGIRLDRDERHLQTEIAGIRWRPEYVDAAVLDKALEAIPAATREAAYRKYQTDVRDTSTPEGMASLLLKLAQGKLFSVSSTRLLLDVMEQTATFPDRLKAGLSAGWKLGHKTGSSGCLNGFCIATNDVGVLWSPAQSPVAIVVFVSDSRASLSEKAALMAGLARAAIQHSRD